MDSDGCSGIWCDGRDLVDRTEMESGSRIHTGDILVLSDFWQPRCLVSESGKVYERLKEKDLPGSRKAVSMIVGRDTENLSLKE